MDDNERRDGIVDRINQAYGSYQNAKNMVRLGRGIASAGRAIGALAATSEIWGPIAIVIGAVLIFTIIIVVLTSGPGAAFETSQTQTQTTSTNISGLFNLTGATDSQREEIQTSLSQALSYPLYSKLLTSDGAINVVLKNGCGGYVPSSKTIELYVSSCPAKTRLYLMHETGHIIATRNTRAYQSFPHAFLKEADLSCYDSQGFIITYPHNKGEGDAFTESFAEAVALFLYYKDTSLYFPGHCSQTYEWVRENIFQGSQTLR